MSDFEIGDNMGFWDNFKDSYDKESERYANERIRSNYKTVKQREIEEAHKFDYLYGLSDTDLLSKYNGIFTVEEEKAAIEKELLDRGYKKATNGTFHHI